MIIRKINLFLSLVFDGKDGPNEQIYRWRCRNGCYVSVRTNWSWFIHPWRRQIDFIIGKHVVLTEPINKNIFEENLSNFNSTSTAATTTPQTTRTNTLATATLSGSEAALSSSTKTGEQQQQKNEAITKRIVLSGQSSNNSNLSNSLAGGSSSKREEKSYSTNGDNPNGQSTSSSTFLFGFEDKQRVFYLKSVEKDIVEYISRVSER